MKKLLALACAASAVALTTSGAFATDPAPSNSYSVTINGSVPAICKISAVGDVTVTGGVTGGWNSGSTTAATATLTSLTDGDSKTVATGASTTLTLINNGNCSAKLKSLNGGLLNSARGYTLTYQAQLAGNSLSNVSTSEFSPKSFGYADGLTPSLPVSFSIGSGTQIPSGSYTDTLTLNLYATL